MTSKTFIAGDWGTTSCRVYLFGIQDDRFTVLDTKTGLGVSKLNNIDIEVYFNQLIHPWTHQYEIITVLLSGMVGSTIGWRATPYSDCPLSVNKQLEQSVYLESNGRSVGILAGIKTINPFGLPDTMRGEEVQLVGMIEALSDEEDIVAILPGTHNKWAFVQNGVLTNFFTSYTGELFSTLNEHSILTNREPLTDVHWPSFDRGVLTAKTCDSDLLGLLFSTRAHQLVARDNIEHDASYLLGLIVSRDIDNGLRTARQDKTDDLRQITIVGDDQISQTYVRALSSYGIESQCFSAGEAAKLAYPIFFQKHLEMAN